MSDVSVSTDSDASCDDALNVSAYTKLFAHSWTTITWRSQEWTLLYKPQRDKCLSHVWRTTVAPRYGHPADLFLTPCAHVYITRRANLRSAGWPVDALPTIWLTCSRGVKKINSRDDRNEPTYMWQFVELGFYDNDCWVAYTQLIQVTMQTRLH